MTIYLNFLLDHRSPTSYEELQERVESGSSVPHQSPLG